MDDHAENGSAAEPPEQFAEAYLRRPFYRRLSFWLATSAGSLLLLALFLFAVTWFYSSEIQSGAFELDRSEDEFKLRVAAFGDGTITLAFENSDDAPDSIGTFGLESESGAYGQIGDIVSEADGEVVRVFEPLVGGFGLGNSVRVERDAFPRDPGAAFGVEYSDVEYRSLGPMPAWFVLADEHPETWAVMVHGRTGTRTETLRALQTVHDFGLPVLSINYRNDEGVAEDPSGEYGFGTTEWEDLEAAVEYAFAHGAEEVILFGFSMGGGIVAHFMHESELAGSVRGLVLDAPLLNLTSALNLAAEQRGLPAFLPWLAANLSSVRFGTDWPALDTRDELLKVDVPMLVFHGTGDETIPISQSDDFVQDFADRLGDVTYIRIEDAEHVGSWNVDPEGYGIALTQWLGEVVGE